jgi:hypothetical protein
MNVDPRTCVTLWIMVDAAIGETPVVAGAPFQVERVPEGGVVLHSVDKRRRIHFL